MERNRSSLTPVVDFVKSYNESGISRFHMPGHKGKPIIGFEPYDITEINGADVLFNSDGILAESRKLASAIFRTGRTFYSTEGSSLCIKAMMCAVLQEARGRGRCLNKGKVLAARNVHKAFVDACALLDLEMVSIVGKSGNKNIDSICCCEVMTEDLQHIFQCLIGDFDDILAVYITSVDYLGNMADIMGISEVCDKYKVPLVVDNAHGAYLAFMENSMHPIHNGAAICCDSAHKTLPVLTGGAYIHISKEWDKRLSQYIDRALALFGSTSPSYLILQSLDMCNRYLSEGYNEKLTQTIARIGSVRDKLKKNGIHYLEGEPLKIVINAKLSGFTGYEIAELLRAKKIECEYADGSFVVLMVTPENNERDYLRIEEWANDFQNSYADADSVVEAEIKDVHIPKRIMSIREAIFSPSELIPAKEAYGRVCAAQTVSCPPAVPIVISGEEIDEEAVGLFLKYGINKVCVVKE